jgi:hypothetical protein
VQDIRTVIQLALHTLSQKHNISLFHLSTMTDSAAFCRERTTSYHNIFSMLCCLRLESVALNVIHISWSTCYCLLCCIDSFFHRKMCSIYACSSHTHTHIFCLFRVFNSPAYSLSMVQHRQETLYIIVSPQQYKNHQMSNGFR